VPILRFLDLPGFGKPLPVCPKVMDFDVGVQIAGVQSEQPVFSTCAVFAHALLQRGKEIPTRKVVRFSIKSAHQAVDFVLCS